MRCSQNVSQTHVLFHLSILDFTHRWHLDNGRHCLPIQPRYKLAKLAVALVPFCCSTQPNYCAATLSGLSLKERDPADIFLWLIYLLLTSTLYNPTSKILERQMCNNEIIYKANWKTTYTNRVLHQYMKAHTWMRCSNKANRNAKERVFRSDLNNFIFPG